MNRYFSRWYDKDPVLSMSMRTLSTSDDATQISVALNLIKVIIEHSIKQYEFESVEDIVTAVEDGIIQRGNRRWYDLDVTVRTAIQMLEKTTSETRQKVALDMAQLVIEKIIQDVDDEEEGAPVENRRTSAGLIEEDEDGNPVIYLEDDAGQDINTELN